MKSLPSINSSYIHSKKNLKIFSNPINSTPNSDDEIEPPPLNLLKVSRHTFFKDKQENDKKRSSNILNLFIIPIQQQKTLFSLILVKILLPNILALLFLIGLMKLESYFQLDCSHDNEPVLIYVTMREIILAHSFYIWTFYLSLFKESESFVIRICLLIGSYIISFFFKYFKFFIFDDREIYIYATFFMFAFQIIMFIGLNKYKGSLGKEEFNQVLFSFALFIIGTVDLIVLRRYIIEEVYRKLSSFQFYKIYFQFFLFCYFNLYEKVVLSLLVTFQNKISKSLLLFLIKNYICSVLCSCIVLPLTRDNGLTLSVLSYLNFFFQISSLYKQRNFILHIITSIFLKNCKGNCIFKLTRLFQKNIVNQNLFSTIAGSTNEVMITITFALINVLIFGKTINYPLFDLGEIKQDVVCRRNFENEVTLGVEKLLFLFVINFIFFIYLILKMKDKKKSKFQWKIESYDLLIKTFYYVIIYTFIDFNFQFYLYLYLLKNK